MSIIHSNLLPLIFFVSILASFAAALVGSYVVLKRITMVSGGISHSLLWGMGLALWLQRVHQIAWATPLLGALVASMISALILGAMTYFWKRQEDAAIAAIWSIGMSIGILFLTKTPGYTNELVDFLFGSLLFSTIKDLWMIFFLDLILLVSFCFFSKRFLALIFDETMASMQSKHTLMLTLFLHLLIAIAIVVLVQVVGVILVITLLAIPASIAQVYAKSFFQLCIGAFLLSVFFCLSGISLSYLVNFPIGPTIALVAGCIYLPTLFYKSRI